MGFNSGFKGLKGKNFKLCCIRNSSQEFRGNCLVTATFTCRTQSPFWIIIFIVLLDEFLLNSSGDRRLLPEFIALCSLKIVYIMLCTFRYNLEKKNCVNITKTTDLILFVAVTL